MNPSTDSRPTGAPRRTGTTRTSASPPVIPCRDEVEPSGRGQGLGLALQTRIVDGVLGQHLVEDGQETRVALERFGRWRYRRCGPYCQALLGGVGVEVREDIGLWILRMRKHFLQLFSTPLLTLTLECRHVGNTHNARVGGERRHPPRSPWQSQSRSEVRQQHVA